MDADVTLTINGAEHQLTVDTRTTLLDLLREHLDLTGAKKGCDHGQCGACTILIDGRRANSCLALAVAHDGAELTTIEGLGSEAELHPLQAAFIERDAFQCGYCTPGQLCSAVGMIAEAEREGATLDAPRDPRAHERQPLPLRRVPEHRRRDRGHRRVKAFAYERAGDAAAAVEAARERRDLPRRRHQPRRPDEARAWPSRSGSSTSPASPTTRSRRRATGRCASAPPSATPTSPRTRSSASATPCSARPLLAGASGQLRNLATVGGNLLQRTRCSYFQDVTKPCNKRRPGSGCPAREGEHRNHAILGHSEHCVATHPSDMAVALAAIGANVHVLGANGERTIPIPGLHRLPGDKPQHDTVLNAGDLITAVELGAPAAALDVPEGPRPRELRVRGVLRRRRGGAGGRRSEGGPDRARRRRPRAVAGASGRRTVLRGARADRGGVRRGGRRGARGCASPSGTTPSKCSWRAT